MAVAGHLVPASVDSASVRVYTLGRFQVCVDGAPLRFAGRTPRRPLALRKVLVALGGESVPANAICDALWPDADGDRAKFAFTAALHRLRKLIGADEAGRMLLESGYAARAIRLYRRALGSDSRAEGLSCGLMRCLPGIGAASEGLVASRRCRDRLKSTFDVAPAPATEAVHRALLAAQPVPTPLQPDPAPTPPGRHGLARLSRLRGGTAAVAALLLLAVLGAALGAGLAWSAERTRIDAAVAEFSQSVALPLPERPQNRSKATRRNNLGRTA